MHKFLAAITSALILTLLFFTSGVWASTAVDGSMLNPAPTTATQSNSNLPFNQGLGNATQNSGAFSLDSLPSSSSTANFLPVTEAFQLQASVDPETQGKQLRLQWRIAPGYYLYQHMFKLTEAANNMPVPLPSMPSGSQEYDEYYEKELTVYHRQVALTLPLPTSKALIIESQGCASSGLCYPPQRQKLTIDPQGEVTITTLDETAQNTLPNTISTSNTPGNLLLMLLFAVLGGATLNFMPCVFPVLSIKALSLSKAHINHADINHHSAAQHGMAYTAGIVLSFLGIALLLIVLREAGEAIGWGFQLQSPIFVALLVYLFVLMGLSFSGLLEISGRWMNAGQQLTQGSTLLSSFMTGLLATLVASPCSAPLMGTALGFALSQSTAVALLIFGCLGLGMALPLLVLACWPTLANYLPKPGEWMVRFKEFLAFPLYLSAIWLLWVLGGQTGINTVAAVLIGAVLLALAAWWRNRFMAVILMLIALVLPWQIYQHDKNPTQHWEPYSAKRLSQLRANNQPVFINATADWCLTCLANEKVALSTDAVTAHFKQQQIVYLKADWSNYDAEITQLLKRHQRSGVPLYVFYPADGSTPVVLPQLLTKNTVISATSTQSNRR